MHIANLFSTQKNLINNIVIDKTLSEYKVFARKYLQLQIKMSDLANETKCSTYWIDTQSKLDKTRTLEKYITCLRDIVALAIDNNYDDINVIDLEPSEYCLSDQFLNLYIDINDLVMSPSRDHFITILEDYLSLGLSLGFNEELIENEFCNTIKVAL